MKLTTCFFLLFALLCTPIFSQTQKPTTKQSLAGITLRSNEELVALIEVSQDQESLGTIEVKLLLQDARRSVRNFIKLAEKGFFDGTTFHRVHKESFIQGGDPLSRDKNPKNDGTGGPGYTLPREKNAKKHVRGAVAIAGVGKRNSGCQFFIDLIAHPGWDGEYTVFGHVVKGIEIADQIGRTKLNRERPVNKYSMKVRVEKRKRKMKLY